MTAFARVFGLSMLLCATGHAAEHVGPPAAREQQAEERVSFSLSNRAGLVVAPFVTAAFPEVSGFANLLIGGAAVRVSGVGWLRLRVPVGFVALDLPAGAQEPEAALGNVELGLERPIPLAPASRLELLAALVVPSAEHGPEMSLFNNRALALVNALNAGKDSALLTPGVTGLRLGAGVEHTMRRLELRANLDVPLLVRVSDASLPDDTETHPMGLMPALELKAAYRITSWFGASLGAALVTEPLRVQEPTLERDRNRRVQPVVEPGLTARLGRHVALGLDASVPLGGNLGGDAWSIGTHARLAF